MKFEDALKCMREWKEVKYRNDVYYIDKKGRLRVRYSDVEMRLVPCFTAEQIMSEEWEINMLKNQKKINISDEVSAENQKLKSLLKECREIIANYNFFVMGIVPQESDLITKIDEVLNEKL